MLTIYCDSSTMAGCYVIVGEDPIIITYNNPLTVNKGEYTILIEVLAELLRRGINEATIYSDSQLVVNQLNGYFKCNLPHLRELLNKARQLKSVLTKVSWTPREENLAGLVLDS